MTLYQVHYSATMSHGPDAGKAIQMISLPVEAKSEREAIAKVKETREGSFGHWVNRLANQSVS